MISSQGDRSLQLQLTCDNIRACCAAFMTKVKDAAMKYLIIPEKKPAAAQEGAQKAGSNDPDSPNVITVA
jgi:hypothetical protein